MGVLICSLVLIALHVVAAHDYLSLLQQFSLDMPDRTTCAGSGHAGPGCCNYASSTSCKALARKCYCDRFCHLPRYNDCCSDIKAIGCFPRNTPPQPTTPPPTTPSPTTPPPTTPSPTTPPPTTPTPTVATPAPSLPPQCTALQLSNGQSSGCCTGGESNCWVFDNTGLCYCHENCHREGNCCDDITAIGCYPKNCTQANRTCCDPTMDANNCRVTTGPNTGCYCNSGCTGKDCCPDHSNCNMAVLQEPQLQLSQSMRMRLLARLMADIPSQEWNDFRTANLRRRFRAGVIARMQQYYDRERPQPGYYYGRK